MYGIYANIGGIFMGSMLPYIAAPWILWVIVDFTANEMDIHSLTVLNTADMTHLRPTWRIIPLGGQSLGRKPIYKEVKTMARCLSNVIYKYIYNAFIAQTLRAICAQQQCSAAAAEFSARSKA